MAKDLNNLSIVGRATKDAAIAYTGSGTCYAKFSIAVHGFKANAVSFFDCVMWGKPAENIGKYITKGKQLALTAEVEQNSYTNQDNKTVYKVQFKVNSVQFIASPKNRENESNETEALFATKNTEQLNDDIPF